MLRTKRHVTANRRAMFSLEHRNRKLEKENDTLRKKLNTITDTMVLVVRERTNQSPEPVLAISIGDIVNNLIKKAGYGIVYRTEYLLGKVSADTHLRLNYKGNDLVFQAIEFY